MSDKVEAKLKFLISEKDYDLWSDLLTRLVKEELSEEKGKSVTEVFIGLRDKLPALLVPDKSLVRDILNALAKEDSFYKNSKDKKYYRTSLQTYLSLQMMRLFDRQVDRKLYEGFVNSCEKYRQEKEDR